jgi:FkbM family methyltransferase
VVAFEPEPGNAALLRHNFEINELTHVTVIEKAVSSHLGQAKPLLDTNPVKSAVSQFRTSDDVTGEMAIEAVQIDQVVVNQQVPPPALVKIDVEDTDYAVMQGMTHTLYEVDDGPEEVARIREGQIERFLNTRGYKIRRPDDSYLDTRTMSPHWPLESARSICPAKTGRKN